MIVLQNTPKVIFCSPSNLYFLFSSSHIAFRKKIIRCKMLSLAKELLYIYSDSFVLNVIIKKQPID